MIEEGSTQFELDVVSVHVSFVKNDTEPFMVIRHFEVAVYFRTDKSLI